MQSPTLRLAWIILLVADLAVAGYGLLAMLLPVEMLGAAFERFTGQPWADLLRDSPRTAAYLTLLFRLLGALNAAIGVLGVAIVLGAFRQGAAWAWYALLAGNALGYGGPIAHDLTMGAITIFEQIEMVLAALIVLALIVSAPALLAGWPRQRRSPPADGAAHTAPTEST